MSQEQGSAMPAEEPLIRTVSDTALWVAACRARETGRRRPLFRDPLARRLAGDRGFAIAASVPSRLGRMGVRWNVVLRTAVIDEIVLRAVAAGGADTVLNLAAGLDARPYRLDLPPELRWIEVDLPALLDYKEHVLAGETPRCRLERVGLDLTDRDARVVLFERVAASSRATLVLSEGLLAYLRPEDVAALAQDLRRCPSLRDWVLDMTAPSVAAAGRTAANSFGSSARTHFAPEEGFAFFRPYGWVEAEEHDLTDELPRLGRGPIPSALLRGFVGMLPKAERSPRVMGVVRLEREGLAASGVSA